MVLALWVLLVVLIAASVGYVIVPKLSWGPGIKISTPKLVNDSVQVRCTTSEPDLSITATATAIATSSILWGCQSLRLFYKIHKHPVVGQWQMNRFWQNLCVFQTCLETGINFWYCSSYTGSGLKVFFSTTSTNVLVVAVLLLTTATDY